MASETVVSPPIPGAGRSAEWYYPTFPNTQYPGGPNSTVLYRGSGSTELNATTGTNGAGAAVRVDDYLGSWACDLYVPVVALGLARLTMPCTPTWEHQAPPVGSKSSALACWRIIARMAFSNPAGAIGVKDTGLEVCYYNGVTPIYTGLAFFGFIITGINTISILGRHLDADAPGFSLNLQVPAAVLADITKWHDYEIRIIGATTGAPALAKFLVDGQLVATQPFDGVKLPNSFRTSNNGPYPCCLVQTINYSAGDVTHVYVNHVDVQAAPNESALL